MGWSDKMAKIRLKREAFCSEETCGAFLPVGSLVRYYGRNGIYGVYCHTKMESIQGRNSREMEHRGSRYPMEEVS